MGTRACFYAGNPQDTENATWLGAVAYDGYPEDNDIGRLAGCDTEEAFRAAVQAIAEARDDFADPAKGGFPFPWADDIFLTDYSYAWFDGEVQVTAFRCGWIPLSRMLAMDEEARETYGNAPDCLPGDVPVPGGAKWDRSQPDSIMIISAPRA